MHPSATAFTYTTITANKAMTTTANSIAAITTTAAIKTKGIKANNIQIETVCNYKETHYAYIGCQEEVSEKLQERLLQESS